MGFGCVLERLLISINGGAFSTYKEKWTDPLPSGQESVQIDFDLWPATLPATTGTHKYRICADANGVINEINEGDNCTPDTIFEVK